MSPSRAAAAERHAAVALGGVLGALLRFGQGALVAASLGRDFPWGTLSINLAGSFALAVFLAALLESGRAHPLWRPFFAIGFCGAYTTFSSFELETLALVQGGRPGLAAAYVFGSVASGLALAHFGSRPTRAGLGRHALALAPPILLASSSALGLAVLASAALARLEHVDAGPLLVACAAVAAGGSAGALARYAVSGAVAARLSSFFPFGTLIVNLTGCFLIGLLYGIPGDAAGGLSGALLVTGFLGGYTTFSTFAWETLALLAERSRGRAAWNVVASAGGGFLAVAAGRSIGLAI